MGAGQAMKRIPRIKFPQRHHKSSEHSSSVITSHHQETSENEDLVRNFSRSSSSMSIGGKASDQPKRTPVSQEEIEAILLGGCI